MKLLFLGTGAADWDPAQAHLGDEKALQRRTTSVLVNGDLLIDPNPAVPEAMASFGADRHSVRNVLISHSHGDHYSPDTLLWLAEDHPVTVYGDGGYPQKLPRHPNLTFVAVKLGQSFEAGGYEVTAIPSTHTVEESSEQALHYLLSRDGRHLFYGCDGAWMLPTAFEMLSTRRYDCMILDATFGADAQLYRIPGGKIFFYHNNTTMLQMLRAAFLNAGCADDRTVFVADHLARAYFPDGERAKMAFQPLGFVPAYDGMTLMLDAGR